MSQRQVTLVHTSDVHIDDDVNAGRRSGLDGLLKTFAKATAISADVVLLAGDTFDNHRISVDVLRQAADVIAGADVPVVLLPGNHDSIMPDCLFTKAGLVGMPRIHVLGVTERESVLFRDLDVEICGRPRRGFDDDLVFDLARRKTTRWQIVMAHGHYVAPDEWDEQPRRSWRFGDRDLQATGADYVALGHWDRAAQAGDGQPPAYYSGSPDHAGTVNVVRLRADSGVQVSREPLDWS